MTAVKAIDGVYEKEFKWSYGGYDWSFNMSIPKALYDDYKAVPDSRRVEYGPGGYDYLVTSKDAFIVALAGKLNETSVERGYSSFETVSFVLAFIQSLPYTSD